MKTNPNTNAGGIGGAIGVAITWLLGHYHVALSPEAGAAIATGTAALVLYIGRDGLGGVFRILWRGTARKKSPPPPPPPPPPVVQP